jgi:membrane associated rhomboid family serine protease
MSNRKHISITNSLILACVSVFALAHFWFASPYSGYEMFYWESPLFRPRQLLSHLFLHGGGLHLAFNMLALWMFGNVVEQVWGWSRFLLYYLACGLGAGLVYQIVNYYEFQAAIAPLLDATISFEQLSDVFSRQLYYPNFPSSEQATLIFNTPVVGASGAIYGVLVAFACLFPNHKMVLIFLPFPIAAKYFVPILLGLDIFSGVTGLPILGSNIAHAAHVGGAITGALLMLGLAMLHKNRGPRQDD